MVAAQETRPSQSEVNMEEAKANPGGRVKHDAFEIAASI